MQCPFAGDGHHISHEDIVEGVPRWNGQYVYNAIYHHNVPAILHANEEYEEEELEEQAGLQAENPKENNKENIEEDEEYAENDRYYEGDEN